MRGLFSQHAIVMYRRTLVSKDGPMANHRMNGGSLATFAPMLPGPKVRGTRRTVRKYTVPTTDQNAKMRQAKVARPIFNNNMGGSDGDRSRMMELFTPRKLLIVELRRNQDPRYHTSGTRYTRRPHQLTPIAEATTRKLVGTKSLRALAAEFNVSHQTIRVVCQRSEDCKARRN